MTIILCFHCMDFKYVVIFYCTRQCPVVPLSLVPSKASSASVSCICFGMAGTIHHIHHEHDEGTRAPTTYLYLLRLL